MKLDQLFNSKTFKNLAITPRLLTLDRRSLATFRIFLGLVILTDLLTRFGDLRAHYTDWGILPRFAVLENLLSPWSWSIHLFSGLAIAQALLFVLGCIFALGLTIGYQTRLVTFLSWLFLVSLHNRNPLILNGGDEELRLLLFWSLFLPLGDYFSLDRKLGYIKPPSSPAYTSAATFALLLQTSLIYWVAWAHKIDPVWRTTGEAVYYALSLDQMLMPVGLLIYQFPRLMQLSTFFTLWLELLGPFLLWIPYRIPIFRSLAIFLFVTLHMGFHLSLNIGLFGFIGATPWIAFIPGSTWDKAIQEIKLRRFFQVISYRIQLLLNHVLKFLTHQGFNVYNRRTFNKRLDNGQDFIPDSLFHKLALICTNNYLRTITILSFSLLITLWNLASLPNSTIEFPNSLRPIVLTLGLNQNWKIFSPHPPYEDGWYVIPGQLGTGEQVDIFQKGKPVSWLKPAWVVQSYKNESWRKYLITLLQSPYPDQRLHYGQYLCRQWNENLSLDDPHRLKTFEVIFLLEKTLPNYKTEPITPLNLWNHQCE